MPYYRIKELLVPDKKETYYIYQGNEEKDVQLNAGYSTSKILLESLYLLTTKDDPISLYIYYYQERLQVFFKNNNRDLLQDLQLNVPQCTWEITKTEIDTSLLKEKVALKGCASPLVLHERDENLLDELIKMLPKQSFLIQVKIEVKNDQKAKAEINRLEEHINKLSQSSSIQVGEQGHFGENIKRMLFGGENVSYQLKNITAQKQLEILQNHLYTLNTQGFIFKSMEYNIYAPKGIAEVVASKMETFSRRSGSLSLHYIRREIEEFSLEYLNYVPSNYGAAILALPMKGTTGIKQRKPIDFGVDSGEYHEDTIKVGNMMKHYETDISANIPLKDLTKHAFITGVTGSGKTSTIKSILTNAYKQKVPFLILEPAKTEYQYLENSIESLRRFTLGVEGANSFKINPFYCPPNIHIQTHLDLIKSVFIAAFPMYGPMPYILETAIYNIYRRTGWDFISGKNVYEQKLNRRDLFPTLEDLYEEIDEATTEVGYSNDLSNDIRGALKVRIGSLLSGAKGRMLNTSQGNSITELLHYPTVMELESIGDDQEKVFLMGLLLIAVYEEHISNGNHANTLKHLLVIEEAHRLLENVKESSNMEMADMKGKAITTFNNILSEIRTYGQGLIIADQIPMKLSPDIIKNTNMKLIHRLYAKDDRLLLGESIGLQEDQIDEIINLQEGEAILFHGKIQEAIKVKVNVDLNLLAQHQSKVKKMNENQLDIPHMVLQLKWLKETFFKRINTYLLFPEKKGKVIQLILKDVKEHFGLDLPLEKEILLFKEIVKTYWKEKRKPNDIHFLQFKKILNDIDETNDALSLIGNWFNECKKETNHPMKSYSSLYTAYAKWRELFSNCNSTLDIRGKNISYNNRTFISYLKNHHKVQASFDIKILNPREIHDLSCSLMLFEFKEDLPILEKFFEIKDLNPLVKL
ncbi:ATP-binding protein [Bacillus sp. Y1]|nr:DUF87 domain-containing protein [Bacillus sp. Y1]